MNKFIIRPFRPENINEVKKFNKRLRSLGSYFTFPESPIPNSFPKINDNALYREHYLCIENSKNVVGAYIMQNQTFFVNGSYQNLADFMLPISEGSVNKKYNFVGILLQKDAIKKQPKLFALGMGGEKNSIYKFHKANRWKFFTIPFYFKIINPSSFLKNIQYLKKNRITTLFLSIIEKTLIITLILKVYNLFFNIRINKKFGDYVEINNFSKWSDKIWSQSKEQYDLIAKRDSSNLNILYSNKENIIRLKIKNKNITYGWCVLKKTRLNNHNHFGNMYLGTIVDLLSLPGFERKVIQAALYYFKENKVDLIVTNQSYEAFGEALLKYGFFKGPSNFDLAVSKKLAEELNNKTVTKFHLNRGDGDGPINL